MNDSAKTLLNSILAVNAAFLVVALFTGAGGMAFLMAGMGVCAGMLYFIPSFAGFRRDHPSANGILVLNLFLGWLLIPWVIALVWAVSGREEKATPAEPAPEFFLRAAAREQEERECPFCAEIIKFKAKLCKHCGKDLQEA